MLKTKHRALSVLMVVFMLTAVCFSSIITSSAQQADKTETQESGTMELTTQITEQTSVEPSETELEGSQPTDSSKSDLHQTGVAGASGQTVYCLNEAGWSTVNCYMWDKASDNKENKGWPGVPMIDLGDNIWSYDLNDTYNMIIFSGDGNQTADMEYPGDGYIFNNSTNSWEKYDTSPLVIKSITTDSASPQYKGTQIAITANATIKTGGAISYKFSVSGAQSAVLRDFGTSNTCLWTPTVAGSYTIKVDVKDTSGNTNSRTIDYIIKDDSTETNPIIKAISPSNSSKIAYNKVTTVSVKAAGGNTGTKLLFYKYVVKDASGNQINNAYYTRNNWYQFTATAQTQYSVEISVQSSDNTTVTKTVTYTAGTGDITPGTTAQTDPPVSNPPVTDPPVTYPPVSNPSSNTTNPIFTTFPPIPGKIMGDADMNGKLNIRDATCIQKWILEYISDSQIDLSVSDVTRDGKVNIRDATSIQKKILEIPVDW